VTATGTANGRTPGGRPCTVCGKPVRDPGNAAVGLCHEHNPERAASRTAQQRHRRHGTTAPPVRFTPAQAHWLYDALVVLTSAENATRAKPDRDTVKALLEALAGLHGELDWVQDEVRSVLKANPAGAPRRPR